MTNPFRLCAALASAAIACSSGATGFINGDFESGSFTGWTIEYATYLGSNMNPPFSPWSTTLPAGHPAPVIIPQYTFQNIDIPAFEGASMAQINAIDGGGYHATRLRQTVTLGPPESNCGGIVRVAWGAVMVDAGHIPPQQPFFEVHLTLNGVDQPGGVSIDASGAAQAGSGWTLGGNVNGEPMYWKTGVIELGVTAFSANDAIEVVMTVADCNQGGHDALALLDVIGLETPCSLACQVSHFQTPPAPYVPNTFTPNGNGVDDTWVIGGVYGACKVRLEVYSQFGPQYLFDDWIYAPPGLLGFDGPVTIWDGVNSSGNLVASDLYDYRLTVRNCTHEYVEVGKILVLY